MKDIESKVGAILTDSKQLERLFALEKQRRGVPATDLAFIGMHNVAQHWWCTQQAVLKSRVDEIDFFGAYLHDRIVYAHRLGRVGKLPSRDEALLDVGSETTLADVETLLRHKEMEPHGITITTVCQDSVDNQGKRVRLINPDLPPEQRKLYEEGARKEGVRVANLEEFPKLRGEFLQESQAERYPTIRWHFHWAKYTVVGVPDGITDKFVYEYKTTKSRFLLNYVKPVALAQADLYGYFFQRSNKRVQIQIIEENVTETYEEAVNSTRAEDTLSAFARVDAGGPARPPKAWKCKGCVFQATCLISQAK